MPYPNPDDLYFVWRDYGLIEDRPRGGLPGTDVAELQNAGGVIESAVAMQAFLGGVFAGPGAEDAMEASVIVTSPGLFEMLGVTPALGRGFTEDDAGPGRPFTIVLTHDLWTTLGADRGILGTDVLLNGRPHTVIASGLIHGALVGVSPSDPATLAAVVVGLALITLATGYAAARRVLTIDPAELLRRD